MGEQEQVPYDRSLAIAERHQSLLALIDAGGHSAAALANVLGVSEATINRDIGFLRSKGHHISSKRLATGWAFGLDPLETADTGAVGERK